MTAERAARFYFGSSPGLQELMLQHVSAPEIENLDGNVDPEDVQRLCRSFRARCPALV